jgi:hypothetical protein
MKADKTFAPNGGGGQSASKILRKPIFPRTVLQTLFLQLLPSGMKPVSARHYSDAMIINSAVSVGQWGKEHSARERGHSG